MTPDLDTLTRALVVSLMTVSLSIMLEEEQLLGKVGKWLKKTIPPHKFPNLHKPIYGCVGCMASVWGSIFYLVTAPLMGFNLLQMGIVMLVGVTLNFILIKLS
jgi:hypothetical protein